MSEQIIDSHCHLDMPAFDKDRQQVLENARAAGVTGFVVPGTTENSWRQILALATREIDIYPALGLHPYFCAEHSVEQVDKLRLLAEREHPVAIGEIGLDFFRPDLDQALQLQLFERQLQVAQELALPVILHTRKAHDQVLKLLKKYPLEGGISHAFNGSWQQARHYIDLGFCLGFGGMLTYERSHRLHKLALQVPLEHIVLETDAPDMPGADHQYQRNSPEYLPEVLDALTKLRSETCAEIAATTSANVRRVLDLADKKQPVSDQPDG